MPLREDQIDTAVRFLNHSKAGSQPRDAKEDFLARKGITAEEIAEAFSRVEKSSPSLGTTASSGGSSTPLPGATSAATQGLSPSATAPQASRSAAFSNGVNSAPWYPVPNYSQLAALQPQLAYGAGSLPAFGQDASSDASGPWWGWLLGGAAVGLGAGALTLGLSSSRQDSGGWLPPGAGAASMQSPESAHVAPSGAPHVKDGAAVAEQNAVEEFVALIRQQSEEARANAAVFAKALQTQHDQYQQLFEEMQRFMAAQLQQQKPVTKPQPTELSAGTLQALAGLMREAGAASGSGGAVAPEDSSGSFAVSLVAAPDADSGRCPTATLASEASSSAATVKKVAEVDDAGDNLGKCFGAIGLALQRLTWESASKAAVTKSLNTLAMLLQNLVNNPTVAQHRKVNASGARFRDLLAGSTPGGELMLLAGFQYQAPNFIMSLEQSVEAAQHVLDLIQEHQRHIDQVWANRSPPADAPDVAAGGSSASQSGRSDALAAAQSQAPVPAATGGPSAPGYAAGSNGGPAAFSQPPATAAAAARPWAIGAGRGGLSTGLQWPSATVHGLPASSSSQPGLPPQQVPHPVLCQRDEVAASADDAAVSIPAATIAHPAESQAAAAQPPSMPIAHPAEAQDALDSRGFSANGLEGSDGAAAGTGGAVSGPPSRSTSGANASSIAHPAESSEEPQSGG